MKYYVLPLEGSVSNLYFSTNDHVNFSLINHTGDNSIPLFLKCLGFVT